MRPGKNRDGYFTNEDVVKQLQCAVELVRREFPYETHVFVYDNAPSHTKRPAGSISARQMTKKPKKNFEFPSIDSNGKKTMVRMEDGRLADGTRQSFYFPDNDKEHPGWFKGMAQILHERRLSDISEKLYECPGFKCEEGRTDCCCRRALFSQPDFEARDSILEEVARSLGTQVIFLPKYHCELNPIEQLWGQAKKVYREKPESNREAALRENMEAAVKSVPELSIRK